MGYNIKAELVLMASFSFGAIPLNAQVRTHSSPAASCKIGTVNPPYANDKNEMNGEWINVGQVYHEDDLAIRVKDFNFVEGESYAYVVDIKTPDYSGTARIRVSGIPFTFRSCGKEISIAVVKNSRFPDAFTIGTF